MTRTSTSRKDGQRTWKDTVSMQKHAHWYVDILMNNLVFAKLQALDEFVTVAAANQGGSSSSPNFDLLLPEKRENLFLDHLKRDPRPLDNIFPLQQQQTNLQNCPDQTNLYRDLAEQLRTMVRKGREIEEKEDEKELANFEADLQNQTNEAVQVAKKRGRPSKKSLTFNSNSIE